jgi:hypothetical protein
VDALKRTGQQLNSEERMGKLVAVCFKENNPKSQFLNKETDYQRFKKKVSKSYKNNSGLCLWLNYFPNNQLFSQLPAHLQSEPEEEQKLVPSAPRNQEDRRTRFLNKTLDWALKSAQGRPELLEACVHLQRNFADVLASEGRTEQAERLVTAADWLLAEV